MNQFVKNATLYVWACLIPACLLAQSYDSYDIGVVVHIIGGDNGEGALSEATALASVQRANTDFTFGSWELNLFVVKIIHHNDNDLTNLHLNDLPDFFLENNLYVFSAIDEKAVNLYFVETLSPAALGYASLPPNRGGHEDLWVCGYASNYSSSILLHFDGSEWQTNWRLTPEAFAVSTYEGLLQSLCALGEDSLIVVGGDGVFRQDRIGNSPPKRDNINLNAFPQSIRGNAPNNLFIVGFNGMVWHFNGRSWHFFNNLHNPNWTFESVSVLGNFVVAVGEDASEGISKDLVLIGHRN